MKYKWEEKDIIAGRIVCKPCDEKFQANGWSAKWTMKIGWLASAPSSKHFCTIALTDGMVGPLGSAKEMATWLNKENMIPMPHKWLMATMDYLRDCYNP